MCNNGLFDIVISKYCKDSKVIGLCNFTLTVVTLVSGSDRWCELKVVLSTAVLVVL